MGEQVAARSKWGRSSVGRAPALQAGGQEFESLRLHSGESLKDKRKEKGKWKHCGKKPAQSGQPVRAGENASAGMPNLRFVIPQLRCLYIQTQKRSGKQACRTLPILNVHLLRNPGLIAQPVRAHA